MYRRNKAAALVSVIVVSAGLAPTWSATAASSSAPTSSPPTAAGRTSYVAHVTAQSHGQHATVPAPRGTTRGDLQVVTIGVANPRARVATPKGWSKVRDNRFARFRALVFASRSIAPVTFNTTRNSSWRVDRTAYRGAASIASARLRAAGTTTYRVPSLTSTGPNTMLVGATVTTGKPRRVANLRMVLRNSSRKSAPVHVKSSPTASPTPSQDLTVTPIPSSFVVDLRSYGAVCDGATDDRPAVVRALDYLAARGGGTLSVPNANCRMLQTASSVFTGIGANIAIVGSGPNSKLSLACDSASGYREMFRVDGSNVIFQNIALVRTTACSGIMVALHPPFSAFTMKNVVLDGASSLGGEMSGMIQPNFSSGTYSGILLVGTTIKNFSSYGFFQPNEARTSTDGVVVDGCTFTNNGADDLEFNAPAGVMRNLTIKNSTFSHNHSDTTNAGFGIGLANVQNAMISNNSFDSYNYEPIHVEDRSSNVAIQDNTFTNSSTVATGYSSQIFIVSGSKFVTIKRNTFDTTGNLNRMVAVFIGPGGPTSAYPSDITIQDNTFTLTPRSTMIYNAGIQRLVVSTNTIRNVA